MVSEQITGGNGRTVSVWSRRHGNARLYHYSDLPLAGDVVTFSRDAFDCLMADLGVIQEAPTVLRKFETAAWTRQA